MDGIRDVNSSGIPEVIIKKKSRRNLQGNPGSKLQENFEGNLEIILGGFFREIS